MKTYVAVIFASLSAGLVIFFCCSSVFQFKAEYPDLGESFADDSRHSKRFTIGQKDSGTMDPVETRPKLFLEIDGEIDSEHSGLEPPQFSMFKHKKEVRVSRFDCVRIDILKKSSETPGFVSASRTLADAKKTGGVIKWNGRIMVPKVEGEYRLVVQMVSHQQEEVRRFVFSLDQEGYLLGRRLIVSK